MVQKLYKCSNIVLKEYGKNDNKKDKHAQFSSAHKK